MRSGTRQRKHAMAGLRAIAGEERNLGTLVLVLSSGKQALNAVRLERGRMVAERVMLIEREKVAGRDDYPTDSALQKWEYEAGSLLIGDQKDRVTRPRLRPVVHEAVPVQSYSRLHSRGQCSEELLEKILRGVSAQPYTETLLTRPGRSACRPPRSRASAWR